MLLFREVDGIRLTLSCSGAEPQTRACQIVSVHGYFSASRIGPNRLFVEAEEALTIRGVQFVRYDWPGMGESPGSQAETTLDRTVGALSLVWGEAARTLQCPTFLLAHSLGVPVALEFARRHAAPLAGVILLAPGPLDPLRMHGAAPGFQEAGPRFERKGLILSGEFLREIVRVDWMSRISDLRVPTLVLCASDDPYCDAGALRAISRRGYAFKELPDGGHSFQSCAAKRQAITEMARFVSQPSTHG